MMLGAQAMSFEFVIDFLAMRAQRAQQPLGEHRRQTLGNLERLEPEVGEAGDGRRRVDGVHRRQHEMPGVCRLPDDLRDLRFADFADHDDVRILPEQRAKHRGKRVARAAAARNLRDAGDRPLHRILDAHDVGSAGAEMAQRGVERGGCSGAGGAGEATPLIRLEDVRIGTERVDNALELPLVTCMYLGDRWECLFKLDDVSLRAYSKYRLDAGSYWLHMPAEKLWVF